MTLRNNATMLAISGVSPILRRSLTPCPPRPKMLSAKLLICICACAAIALGQTSLVMQDRSHDNDSPDTSLYADYELFNTGTAAVPLSSITFRYWFVDSNPGDTLVFSCDYAAVGCANITSKFVKLGTPVAMADTYVQIGFTSGAGSLAAGQQTGEIQTRVHDIDYMPQFGANDYSFISDPSFVYKNTQTITVYVNGALVWGVEPSSVVSSGGGTGGAPPPSTALQVQDRSHDNDSPDTTLYADYELFNTGTTSIPLSNVTFRYWFVDSNPGDTLVFNCDYAAVGTANISSKFVKLATPVARADTYVQIGFSAAAGSLGPGAQTGEIQTRVHDADFALQNGANDYSFISDPSFVYKPTQTVTAYINGVLIWGVEPK